MIVVVAYFCCCYCLHCCFDVAAVFAVVVAARVAATSLLLLLPGVLYCNILGIIGTVVLDETSYNDTCLMAIHRCKKLQKWSVRVSV